MSRSALRVKIERLIADGKLVISDGYRAKNSELSSKGFPFARAGNIDGGFDFEQTDCLPTNDVHKVGIKLSEPGDVVFTSKGTVGRFALVRPTTPRFVYSPQLCFWRSVDQNFIDPRWLFYWMHSREFTLQYRSVAGQTDMAEYVSLRDQRRMSITLPDIAEQRAIAHILGMLDDKIGLNRRMNETLEAIARALFKSWFVDFDPVRAKAEGRDPGLPPHIADLFPDGFEDSELGEIPKGWRVESLSKAIQVNPPRQLRKGEIAPYLDMANMPTRSARAAGIYHREYGSGARFVDGDTLVARITPCLENGKTCFVDFLGGGKVGWGSTEFIVLRPRPPLPPEFAYFLARNDRFRSFAISNMTGTSGRQRVSVDCFDHFPVVVPTAGIAERFGAIASSAIGKMKTSDDQSHNLAAIRDALLPKLMSGEVRVKDAERFVGSVAG